MSVSKITAEHREEYNANGCVRIEGVFDQYWIDKVTSGITQVVDSFRRGGPPDQIVNYLGSTSPACYDTSGSVQMNGIAGCSAELVEWINHSPAAETVATLIGADSVRFWVDAAFIKTGSAASDATPWHNDECTYGFKGQQIPSLWMALTDVDEDDAPLLTLAGSNHDAWRYHSTFSPQDIERPPDFHPWQELLDRVSAKDADIRVWPVKKGDALVIHPKTIHGSRPFKSRGLGGQRMAYSVRWLGSDPIWDPNPLSLKLENVPDPDLLVVGEAPSEEIFPVVWRRT